MARGCFGEIKVSTQIIEKPAESLTGTEKATLAKELTPITAEGFMRDVSTTEGFSILYQDVYTHVINCDRLIVIRGAFGVARGFLAVGLRDFERQKLYHLEGIIISPQLQGSGLTRKLLETDLKQCGAGILGFHTQSRLMEKLGEKVSMASPELAKKIAREIGTKNLVNLEEGSIDKGRYGGECLYGDIKKFDQIAIKRSGFNYHEGDAIVFAGYIGKENY